ncbi:hypothetical protein, partial [Carbonactinospora thermoautotrophica]|uniref:hypothetical protein n=1 Tax=Carbonactinospora thermoautotrophica TaxID=1469144 RepID=UPI001E43DFEA
AEAGHQVHVIGKDVPEGYRPAGFTVSSAGGRSAFKKDGARGVPQAAGPPARGALAAAAAAPQPGVPVLGAGRVPGRAIP